MKVVRSTLHTYRILFGNELELLTTATWTLEFVNMKMRSFGSHTSSQRLRSQGPNGWMKSWNCVRTTVTKLVNKIWERMDCLPRDVMHKARPMPSCGVRPSASLSRSWILSKRIKVSSSFFSLSGSQTILVFPYQRSWQYANGDL